MTVQRLPKGGDWVLDRATGREGVITWVDPSEWAHGGCSQRCCTRRTFEARLGDEADNYTYLGLWSEEDWELLVSGDLLDELGQLFMQMRVERAQLELIDSLIAAEAAGIRV